RGCRSGPEVEVASTAWYGTVWYVCGDGSGEGTWPVPTVGWFDGRMLTAGDAGTGGGGIGFADARLEALREWVDEPGRVLMSGIAASEGVYEALGGGK